MIIITIIMSIMVGIAKELFYRGFVFYALKNKTAAVFVSSILFGLMHLSNIFSSGIMGAMMQVVMTFIVGIAFSVTLFKVKNIIPLIIIHSTFDLISFMEGMFKSNLYNPDIFRMASIITLLLTAIVVLISFMISKKNKKI